MTLTSFSPTYPSARRTHLFGRSARFTRSAPKSEFGTGSPASPRKRLTLGALLIATLILTLPFVTPGGIFVDVSYGGNDLLAIDSPSFSLDTLPVTSDGFLLKRSTQTATTDRSGLSNIIAYTVEQGDSLSSIAAAFGVSQDTIVWENEIADPHRLRVGSTLRILPISGITHVVSPEDTVASLAKKYGLTTEKLAKQNRLEENALLVAGSKIIVPGGRKAIAAPTRYLAAASQGSYAAYRSKTTVEGAIIQSNRALNKTNKWMIKPTEGNYTTYFGGRRGHYAVDIANRSAPPILAAAAGTIVSSQCGWNGGYGCMIVIDHGDGIQTLYGHLRSLSVKIGERVTQGQQIGNMGNTGRVYGATGIHLHFEVIDHGRKKNPLAYY